MLKTSKARYYSYLEAEQLVLVRHPAYRKEFLFAMSRDEIIEKSQKEFMPTTIKIPLSHISYFRPVSVATGPAVEFSYTNAGKEAKLLFTGECLEALRELIPDKERA